MAVGAEGGSDVVLTAAVCRGAIGEGSEVVDDERGSRIRTGSATVT